MNYMELLAYQQFLLDEIVERGCILAVAITVLLLTIASLLASPAFMQTNPRYYCTCLLSNIPTECDADREMTYRGDCFLSVKQATYCNN